MNRSAAKELAVSFSISNICWIGIWIELHFFKESAHYYMAVPIARRQHIAALIAVTILTLVFYASVRVACMFHSRVTLPLVRICFVSILILPLNVLRISGILPLQFSRFKAWLDLHSLLMPSIILVALLILSILYWNRVATRYISTLFLILLPFGIFMFGRSVAVLLMRQSFHFPATSLAGQIPVLDTTRPKVLLLLFDELDQRILFDQRPEGLSLPTIDKIREQSIYAQNAYPPGNCTTLSIPALLTGRRYTKGSPNGSSDLLLKDADSDRMVNWGSQESVFIRSRDIGFNTHIVGWYHPYCRILGGQLTSCFSEPIYETALGRMNEGSLFADIREQAMTLWPMNRRRLAIGSHESILRKAIEIVRSPDPGFVFIHFSIPHVPAIYDKKRNEISQLVLSNTEGYIGNIVLVDRTLALIREEMRKVAIWDRAVIIITADHGWRESNYYDGGRDYRVPFILKLSQQRRGCSVIDRFETIRTSDLVVSMLDGRVSNTKEAIEFMMDSGEV